MPLKEAVEKLRQVRCCNYDPHVAFTLHDNNSVHGWLALHFGGRSPNNENAAIIYSPSCLTNLHDFSSTEHKINIFLDLYLYIFGSYSESQWHQPYDFPYSFVKKLWLVFLIYFIITWMLRFPHEKIDANKECQTGF